MQLLATSQQLLATKRCFSTQNLPCYSPIRFTADLCRPFLCRIFRVDLPYKKVQKTLEIRG